MSVKRQGQQGFSLIEMMITVVVLAVLLGIAFPQFRGLVQRQRVSSAYNDLLSGLRYARAEAATRGAYVSICPSIDGGACSAGTAYETGWLIYSYPASASGNARAYDASDGTMQLLRIGGRLPGVSIQASDAAVITFGQQGAVEATAGGGPHTAQFVVCARTGSGGVGTNTVAVPGSMLTLGASGGVVTAKLASTAACTAPTS